jgi:hypothetical protein
MDAEQANFLADSCGNIVLKRLFMNKDSIKSIEHIDDTYKITRYMYTIILQCKGNDIGLNKAINEKTQLIDEIVFVVDDNAEHDARKSLHHISFDGGRTFHDGLYAACASLFTQQEIDEMPEDWKECLGMKK